MKTVSDFKRKMTVGAKVDSKLFWKDKTGNLQQQNELTNRCVSVVQSNSFALTVIIDGKEEKSWCDWPKKSEFQPVSENEANFVFEGGMLTFKFH